MIAWHQNQPSPHLEQGGNLVQPDTLLRLGLLGLQRLPGVMQLENGKARIRFEVSWQYPVNCSIFFFVPAGPHKPKAPQWKAGVVSGRCLLEISWERGAVLTDRQPLPWLWLLGFPSIWSLLPSGPL